MKFRILTSQHSQHYKSVNKQVALHEKPFKLDYVSTFENLDPEKKKNLIFCSEENIRQDLSFNISPLYHTYHVYAFLTYTKNCLLIYNI